MRLSILVLSCALVLASHTALAASEWAEITLTSESNSSQCCCDSPHVITVRRDGSFITAPCRKGGTDIKQGFITPEELSHLATQISGILPADLNAPPECFQGIDYGFSAIDLAIAPSSRHRIQEITYERSCYRGGILNVYPIYNDINSLEIKYYPTGS